MKGVLRLLRTQWGKYEAIMRLMKPQAIAFDVLVSFSIIILIMRVYLLKCVKEKNLRGIFNNLEHNSLLIA